MKRRLLNQIISSGRALSLLILFLMLNSITAWAAGSSMLNFVVERADAGVYVFINCSTAAAAPTIKYSISYADGTSVTNQTYDEGFLITSPCTITAYTEIDGKKGEEATAKYFGLASEEVTGVVGESVAAPQIVPDTDGAYVYYQLNDAPEGFASVDERTGAITQMNQIGVGYVACRVYEGQEQLSFTILNSPDEFLSFCLTVIPPAPTIEPEGGTFEESQTITLSSTMSGDDVSIYYQWGNDNAQEYSDPIPVKTGTLTAWVEAHDEEGVPYRSETVSADFAILQAPNLKFVDPTIVTNMVEITEATATYNEGFTSPSQQPELYNPEQVSVTYNSSDETVATIDQDGSVTIVGVGSTTISAYSAASDSYMEGSASYELTVSPRDIENATVTIDNGQSYAYTGSEIEPTVTVTDGNTTLTSGTDYTVSYSNNVDVPEAGSNNPPTITVTGTGNYTGTTIENFTITKAEAGLEFSEETASVALNGSTASLPTLGNPAQLQVTYSSSDTNVATVNQLTGEVTLVGPGETTITATTEGDDNYNAGTASYTLAVTGTDYGIIVYTEQQPNGVRITDDNKDAVLGAGNTSVRFDGHNRLVLQDAQLSLIAVTSPNTLPAEGLNIYLEGESTITNNSDYALQSDGVTTAMKLTFSTGSDKPGSLTYTAGSAIGDNNVFQGYDVTYNNNLTRSVEGSTLTVKIPLHLIVGDAASTEQEVAKDIDYADLAAADAPVATQQLVNATIGNVLYTLNDTQQPNVVDDGFYNGQLVVNSTMTDLKIDEIHHGVLSGNLVPGTSEYANEFKGLTFMVPNGHGTISLDVQATPGFEFHLKIGSQDPVKVVSKADNGNQEYAIPYAVVEATYVYLYLVTNPSSQSPHRAGPKATISGGIGGIKIRSSISGAPDAAQNYCLMGEGDYSRTGSGITVNNGNVTDLPGSHIFRGAPARAATADNISFIDLSKTKITGKSYSRDEGAFAGLPETTYIYLPAGNTAKGKNFVIGGICDAMQLDDASDNTFEVAQDFFVAKATFNRSFEAGDDRCYTVYLPFAVRTADVQGDFFTYDSYDNEKGIVKMSKYAGAMLSANTPYIFRPTATTTFQSPSCAPVKRFEGIVSDPEAITESAGLHGLYQYYKWTSTSANIFGFASDMTGGAGAGNAVQAAAGSEMKPFRAYLRIKSTQAPTTLLIDWGDGTSIIPLDKDQARQDADGWYTITGFRLPAKPTQYGVYIYKGKKVAIK